MILLKLEINYKYEINKKRINLLIQSKFWIINITKINKENKLFKESNYKIKEKIKDIPIGKNNNNRKNPYNSNYNIINNINKHNF